MKVKDVLTYDQKIVKVITDKEIAKYFYDKDYGVLLTFLRSGPKTIKEIEQAYKDADNEKSDKTLYRYLKLLAEVGLVAEGGKRVYTDEEHRNKSVSIYVRTAKVFYDHTKELKGEEGKEEKKQKLYKAYKLLLDNLEEGKEFDQQGIESIMEKIYSSGQDLATEMIEKAGDELFELLEDQDFVGVNEFILNLTWLIMLYRENFKDKL